MQQVRTGDLPFERRDRHVDHDRLAMGLRGARHQRDLVPGVGFIALQRAPQQLHQRFGILEQFRERMPAGLVEAHCQQVLRADIGVDHAQLRVEHEDAGRQHVEQFGRIEM